MRDFSHSGVAPRWGDRRFLGVAYPQLTLGVINIASFQDDDNAAASARNKNINENNKEIKCQH